jgi:hypothetical protein
MKYNPQTAAYQVIDAQGYEHITAAKGQTGMEFYRAETFGFYMLSHAYGVKIFGTHNYFMFDQNGGANIWDANGKNLSSTSLGEVINVKLEEVAANLGAKNGSAATAADLASDGSDDDKKEMEDAIKEGFIRKEHAYNLIISNDPKELLEKMEHFQPTDVKKWVVEIKEQVKG